MQKAQQFPLTVTRVQLLQMRSPLVFTGSSGDCRSPCTRAAPGEAHLLQNGRFRETRHPCAAHAAACSSLLALAETQSNPSVAPAARRSHCLRLLDELSPVFFPAEYDIVGYHNKSQLSSKPIDVLQTGKSICEGYAGLFEQMCR